MIDTAVAILTTEGLAGVQARRIAVECGCSVGTLYNTFDGLDDLIVQANARTLSAMREKLMAAVVPNGDETITDRLMALALTYMDFAMTNTRPWRAVFEHRPAANWPLPEWYRAQQNELCAIVENALETVVLDPAERRRAAHALFAAVHGIVTLGLDEKTGHKGLVDELEAEIRFVVLAAAAALQRPAS